MRKVKEGCPHGMPPSASEPFAVASAGEFQLKSPSPHAVSQMVARSVHISTVPHKSRAHLGEAQAGRHNPSRAGGGMPGGCFSAGAGDRAAQTQCSLHSFNINETSMIYCF